MQLLPTLLILSCWVYSALAIPINNGVVGSPEVECLSDRVKMVFTTESDFQGVVYARGFYLDEGCNRPNAGNGASAAVEYEFDNCGVTRRRSLEPKGVFVTGVVVIQFHPFVLTKIDRAIRFQCFYMEADKTVDTDLEVSAITTEFQTFQVPMPVCRYEILDAPGGNPINFAIIGMKVYHQWTCDTDTEDIFCMEVYGCYVNTEAIPAPEDSEIAIRLLDDDGCALDGNLLQNPEYDDSEATRGLSAVKETHVFKYADRPALYFNCQIRIGVRDPGTTCQDYREQTGGQCAEAPLTRRKRRTSKTRPSTTDMGVLDVVPEKPLFIADLDLAEKDIPAYLLNRSPSHSTSHGNPHASRLPIADLTPDPAGFCVSNTFFGILVTFLTVSIVAAVTMAIVLFVRNSKFY